MPTGSTAADDVLVQLCHDLRLLREQAGGPSVRTVALQVGLGKSQMGAILNGTIRRPPEWHVVRGLVEAFYKYAHDRGREERLSIRSGLDEYWRPRYAMVEHAFSQSARAREPRGRTADGALEPGGVVQVDPGTVVPRQLPPVAPHFTGRSAELAALSLDNESGSDQVRPLLPGAPGAFVIVTSRDRLTGLAAREGARRVSVETFSSDESQALLTELLGRPRVEAEPQAASELARLCAHLPLALRVTAANLSARPYRTLAEHAAALRSDDRLTALTADGDEQAAVRAAFDLSYETIPLGTQQIFRFFGIVPGPDLTVAATAAMAQIPATLAEWQLQQLAAEHLVQERARGRYSTHDLLRTYAMEHATRDPASEAALIRLFDWYLAAADAADRLLYPERARTPLPIVPATALPLWEDAAAASGWFDDERANLVAAVRHTAHHGPRSAAWRIAETLGGYFYLGRHMIDWLSSMIAGLIAAESDEAIMSQAVLNLSLAVAHRLNGHNITSIEHAERASILARKADWPKGEAVAHSVVASVRWQSGELRMAVTELNNCLAVYREIGEIAGQAINLSNLGVLYGELGDLPQAIDAATKAMAPLTPEDAVTAAKFRGALGNYLFQSGQFVEAEGHLQEALLLAEQVGDRGNTADILTYLADVSLHFGRYTNAVALAERATAIYEETGYVRGLATGSDIIGRIQHRLGRYDESIAHHERARQIAIKHSFQYPHVQALLGLAEAHTRLRNHDIARGHAMLARDMAANAGFRLLEKKAKTILAV